MSNNSEKRDIFTKEFLDTYKEFFNNKELKNLLAI